MSEEEPPTRYSEEWVRAEWDYERDTARPLVLFVKTLHEWSIAVPGVFFGCIVATVFWVLEATPVEIAGAFSGTFFTGYGLFLSIWWCSTLAE
jgi:hypothetical protein